MRIISLLAILEIAFGTIFSVLSVIRMTIKDLMKVGTCGWLGKGQAQDAVVQIFQARVGVSCIVSGSILQGILLWYECIGIRVMLYIVIIQLVFLLAITILSFREYRKGCKEIESND